jgi:hypothetical protein
LRYDAGGVVVTGGNIDISGTGVFRRNGATLNVVPAGVTAGAYLYWDGSAWVADSDSIHIGTNTSGVTNNAVVIGRNAATAANANAIAIGATAVNGTAAANSIVINSTGTGVSVGTSSIIMSSGTGTTVVSTPSNALLVSTNGGTLASGAQSIILDSSTVGGTIGSNSIAIFTGNSSINTGTTIGALSNTILASAGTVSINNTGNNLVLTSGGTVACTFVGGGRIVMNAAGSSINANTNGFYVSPIVTSTNANILYYNTTTREITSNPGFAVPTGATAGAYLYWGGSAWLAASDSIQIGRGTTFAGTNNVVIGRDAATAAGANAIAIGATAVSGTAAANSIVINSSGIGATTSTNSVILRSAAGGVSIGTNSVAINAGVSLVIAGTSSIVANTSNAGVTVTNSSFVVNTSSGGVNMTNGCFAVNTNPGLVSSGASSIILKTSTTATNCTSSAFLVNTGAQSAITGANSIIINSGFSNINGISNNNISLNAGTGAIGNSTVGSNISFNSGGAITNSSNNNIVINTGGGITIGSSATRSIVLNAGTVGVSASTPGCYINPITPSTTAASILHYNAASFEITSNPGINITGSATLGGGLSVVGGIQNTKVINLSVSGSTSASANDYMFYMPPGTPGATVTLPNPGVVGQQYFFANNAGAGAITINTSGGTIFGNSGSYPGSTTITPNNTAFVVCVASNIYAIR